MTDQTIEKALVQCKDLSVYQSDIDSLTEQYISTLPIPEIVYKSSGFSGLMHYIYNHCLKDVIETSRKADKTNQYDFELLDDIFENIYLPQCFRFNICPTVIQFATLVNISNSHLSDLRSGVYRKNSGEVSFQRQQVVKNWFDKCESTTIGKALNENSIGAMFVSKAVYGYSDQQTIRIETNSTQLESAEQIAAKYGNSERPMIAQNDN